MNKAIPLSLLVVLAVSAVFHVSQWRTIQELQGQLAAQSAKVTEMAVARVQAQHDMDTLREHNEIFQRESATLREKLQRVDAAVRVAATSPKLPVLDQAIVTKATQPLNASDPLIKKVGEQAREHWVASMYNDLAKELSLPPDRQEELFRLLAERQAKRTFKMGEVPKQPMTRELAEAQNEPFRKLLGPDEYRKLENYEKTTGDRVILRSYEERLIGTAAPLQPEQRQRLLQAMVDERTAQGEARAKEMRTPQVPYSEEEIHSQLARLDLLNRGVLNRARGFLTEEQLAVMKRQQQQGMDMQLTAMKRRQAEAQARPR